MDPGLCYGIIYSDPSNLSNLSDLSDLWPETIVTGAPWPHGFFSRMSTQQEESDLSLMTSYQEVDCLICEELHLKKDTHYAHLKTIAEAHLQSNIAAEQLAVPYAHTEDYVDYYLFFYGREYRKQYNELLRQYRREYYTQLLEKMYMPEDEFCDYHQESRDYHFEFRD